MRYLMSSLTACFLLTALFLAACGDADNPVVPTAPAGKTTTALSPEECAAANSLPEDFLKKALQVNPNVDTETLLSTWKAQGCSDSVLWGLSWVASLGAEVTITTKDDPVISIVIIPPNEHNPITAASTDGSQTIRAPRTAIIRIDGEVIDTGVEIRAHSADYDVLYGYYEDECQRLGKGSKGSADNRACVDLKMYQRKKQCEEADYRNRQVGDPHRLDTEAYAQALYNWQSLCPDDRNW